MGLRREKIRWAEFKEGMTPHVTRLRDAILHPWRRGWKGRRGYQDISHAYVNVDVEAARLNPYFYGHIVAFERLIWVALLIWAMVT